MPCVKLASNTGTLKCLVNAANRTSSADPAILNDVRLADNPGIGNASSTEGSQIAWAGDRRPIPSFGRCGLEPVPFFRLRGVASV
jgi:hypothetical protein